MLKVIIASIALCISLPAIAAENIDTYVPQNISAKALWNKLDTPTKEYIYKAEHAKYYNPNDEDSFVDISAVISWDINIRQNPNPTAPENLELISYERGFEDCFYAMKRGLQILPLQSKSPSKIKDIAKGTGAILYKSIPNVFQNRPTYIQQTGPGYAPGGMTSYIVY